MMPLFFLLILYSNLLKTNCSALLKGLKFIFEVACILTPFFRFVFIYNYKYNKENVIIKVNCLFIPCLVFIKTRIF